MEPRGFTRIHLAPDESREVTFVLGEADLRMLDRDGSRVVDPGTFRVMIGVSSEDIRLRGAFAVE